MRRALVSRRVPEEVQLVIVFGVPPLASRDDLGDDLLAYKQVEVSKNST